MTEAGVIVERLSKYSDDDANGIGRLMPFLSEHFTDDPMNSDLLQSIINSPYHEQLVARLEGVIVGTATMNLLMGPGVGKEAYLEDFVVDESIRQKGIGNKVWDEMIRWCTEQGVNLSFTSNPDRLPARIFYLSHDAEIRNTSAFRVVVKR